MKCAICGIEAGQYGHNPSPVLPTEQRVCEDCNWTVVIPARLGNRLRVETYKGDVLYVNGTEQEDHTQQK